MKKAGEILTIDSAGALVVGSLTVVLAPMLTIWHGWSEGFALFVGLVNIAYGCFSGFLAFRLNRTGQFSRNSIIILVIANAVWAGHCFTQVWWLIPSATWLGLSHLIFEGIYVIILAFFEARIVLTTAKK